MIAAAGARCRSGLIARGLDAGAARRARPRILDGMLAQQASVLAFERMFLFAGIAFLFVIPLALLLRKPQAAQQGQARGPSLDDTMERGSDGKRSKSPTAVAEQRRQPTRKPPRRPAASARQAARRAARS